MWSAANADLKAQWALPPPAENLSVLQNHKWLINMEQLIKTLPKEANEIIPK